MNEAESGPPAAGRWARSPRRLGALLAIATWAAACGRTDAGGRGETTAPEPPSPPIPREEYANRRARVMEELADGILLLNARPSEKTMEQWGFVQEPTFLYFSGLPELPGAVLALDGPTRKARLFLPPAPTSFGLPVEGLVPPPGERTAERLGIDAAEPWDAFVPYVRRRLAEGVPALYVDGSRRPEATGSPPGIAPLAGERTLWRAALTEAFPRAEIHSAREPVMRLRAVKSPAEVAVLRRNARTTARALLAVAGRLAPGARQRATEAAFVAACLEAGGEGPSFWPWTMSGPNAHTGRLVHAFFRYDQGDREARAGELVRVDVGCAGGSYGADVGRTLPADGRFDEGQAEAWDLLIAGYHAGLGTMRDGVPVADVRAASAREVERLAASLTTESGRRAAEAILDGGPGVWHLHGVGVESGEDVPDPLTAGMVVAYEPGIAVGEDAYYLEDMILVTADGHEVLSSGLPYAAREVAAVMAEARR